MLMPSALTNYAFTYENLAANPTASAGTQVTPGASNAEGSWTQVATSGNIAQDCYWLAVRVSQGATASNQKDHLLDIGVDPAGGTSYSAIISNIACGGSLNSSATVSGGHLFVFPFYIKAGSSVAVRVQGNNATAGTVRIAVRFYGKPSRPEAVPVGRYSETIGTITNSGGVSFTPGNTVDGTWTSLGTTARPLWWWQLCMQISNSTQAAEACYVELAHGDASNKHVIMKQMSISSTSEAFQDMFKANLLWMEAYAPVPAGAEMWIRGRCDSSPDSGYNAVAIGIGG